MAKGFAQGLNSSSLALIGFIEKNSTLNDLHINLYN